MHESTEASLLEYLSAFKENIHYRIVAEYYGQQRARRSGVLYIVHIEEGLAILKLIEASIRAQEAYCLHPIVQSNHALRGAFEATSILYRYPVSALALALAIEYRWSANSYLSRHRLTSLSEIRLSPLPEVRQMLVADKIQNRKDFELYHQGTHPQSDLLTEYFHNWLTKLGVSEDEYQAIIAKIPQIRDYRPTENDTAEKDGPA